MNAQTHDFETISPPIWRCDDASAINAICNHPDVQPTLSLGAGPIDVAAFLTDRRNICLMTENGGAIFHWTAPGTYAGHDFFLPEARGKYAMAASRAMLSAMFDMYCARMIWGQTPIENRAARWVRRQLGFKSEGVSTAAILGLGVEMQVETFTLEAQACL